MAVGSLYNYYRAQNARLRAYNKQVLDSYDSQVAGLGSALFGTLQNAGASSVSNGWKVAQKRIAAEQQKKIDAALKDLQGTQALINAPTTPSSSSVSVSSSTNVASSSSTTATSASSSATAASSTTATGASTTVTPAAATDTSSTTAGATSSAATTTTPAAPGSSVNVVA
jgi:hypothetical protein